MQHAILGAGGVGGLVGACLARAGYPVTLVVRPDALRNYPNQLQLESPLGNFRVEVERSATVPSADVLWIAVKATQLESSLAAMRNGESIGTIVPLLNGVDHVAMLRARYGAERVVPATISVESERVAPGHIVHRSPFLRLNLASSGRPRLESAVNSLQQAGFACQFIDDEPTLMWSKLVFLAPLALSTSAAGVPKGEVMSDLHRWQQLQACVREACTVAKAEGATVDAEAVIATITGLPPGTRSSMQKDVEKGNPPELDAIAGPILRGGLRRQIAVPVTRSLVAAIEEGIKGR